MIQIMLDIHSEIELIALRAELNQFGYSNPDFTFISVLDWGITILILNKEMLKNDYIKELLIECAI